MLGRKTARSTPDVLSPMPGAPSFPLLARSGRTGLLARPSVFDPTAPPRVRRPLRAESPEVHYFFTSDGVQLCLTRYRGGDKGPVVLCHGLGVSSGIFTVDTIETNLVEYLVAAGFDIWLLDFRVSIELASADDQADADVIAAVDYPEAVDHVRRLTGATTVQMVVHCFGSTVFFMAMLSGALTGVRSAVASQATPFVDAAGMLGLKAALNLGNVFRAVGMDTLDAYSDVDATLRDRLYHRLLALYPLPDDERCVSATCRRISFMYSQLYEHSQLTQATHERLHELFGIANLSASAQLMRMVRAGHIVDREGRDVYLPHVERLALPLLMIHGEENACFEPAGSAASLDWLQSHNDPGLYSRVVIPEFGHIDCIFGARAAEMVYPHILAHLEKTA